MPIYEDRNINNLPEISDVTGAKMVGVSGGNAGSVGAGKFAKKEDVSGTDLLKINSGNTNEVVFGLKKIEKDSFLDARIPYQSSSSLTSSTTNKVAIFELNGSEKLRIERDDYEFTFLEYGFSTEKTIGSSVSNVSRIVYDSTVYVHEKEVYVNVPSGVNYLVVWFWNGTEKENYDFTIGHFSVSSVLEESLVKDVENTNKEVSSVKDEKKKDVLSSDQIYTTSGFQTFPSWYSTDYIDISNWYKIEKVVASTYGSLYSYAFFDSSKTFISGYTSNTRKYENFENVEIPSNAKYIRAIGAANQGGGLSTFEISFYEKKSLQERYREQKTFIERNESYDELNVMLQKICCIGDSLTEGDYGSYPSGTPNVHSQNYPFYLQKLTNAEVDNLGHCGDSAQYWWTHRRNELVAGKDYDCIYIFLGQNGEIAGNVETVTAGGDYWNYGDTNLGGYCAIIEHCKYLYPNAHIFLINQPYNIKEPSWTEKVSGQIAKVSVHYNLPIIDIMNGTPMNRGNGDIYRPVGFDPVNEPYGNQHFGKIGYYTLAKYIAKLTAKFIEENKEKFSLK